MTSTQDINALIERVKAATGPDVDLDYAIAAVLGRGETVPRYTASIDAALALVERMLPGPRALYLRLEMTEMVPPSGLRETTASLFAGIPPNSFHGKAATPPLAILSALLAALQAIGDKP